MSNHPLQDLLNNNREWSCDMLEKDPQFFKRLVDKQTPKYLWIGCADSRVPANEILGLDPGEVFVHRNVANLFIHTDMNALSVLEYAVDTLNVEHIIVCGHYGCGGIKAALEASHLGLIDQWLQHIRDVHDQHEYEFKTSMSEKDKVNLLCDLSIRQQVYNICRTSIVQRAWQHGKSLSVHPWVYDLSDGLIRILGAPISNTSQIPEQHHIINIPPKQD